MAEVLERDFDSVRERPYDSLDKCFAEAARECLTHARGHFEVAGNLPQALAEALEEKVELTLRCPVAEGVLDVDMTLTGPGAPRDPANSLLFFVVTGDVWFTPPASGSH